jgi:WD40 repeat protein
MKRPSSLPIFILLSLALQASTYAQKPDLIVQTGHATLITSLDFSRDGALLASVDDAGVAKLWDPKKGWELFTFPGTERRYHVKFSPTANSVVTLSWRNYEGKLELWQLEKTVKLKFSISLKNFPTRGVVFSADGEHLRLSDDSKERFFDSADGEEVSVEQIKLSKSFSPPRNESRDRSILATIAEEDKQTVELTEIKTKRQLSVLKGLHTCPIEDVLFSHNSKLLATGSWDNKIVLWDLKNNYAGRELIGHSDGVTALAFNQEDSILASGSSDGSIRLWNTSDGSVLKALAGHTDSVISLAISADGKFIATGSGSESGSKQQDALKVWNTTADQPLTTLTDNMQNIQRLTFSNDGRMLACVAQQLPKSLGNPDTVAPEIKTEPIRIWDLDQERKTYELNGGHGLRDAIAFSADSKSFFSVDWWGEAFDAIASINRWDLNAPEKVRTKQLDHYGLVAFDSTKQFGVFQFASVPSTESPYKAVDVNNRPVPFPRLVTPNLNIQATFSRDGKLFAAVIDQPNSDEVKLIHIWDLTTKTKRPVLKGRGPIAIGGDNNRFLASSSDGQIVVWDLQTRQMKALGIEASNASALGFIPKTNLLVIIGDGKTRLWDAALGQELLTLIALDNDDWMVVTPDGLFDGSPAAWGQILWRFGGNLSDTVPLEHFFEEYYTPGLLRRVVAGERPRVAVDIANKDRRQPNLKITSPAAQQADGVTERTVTLKIDISESPAGAQDVRVFRNGSLVKLWPGDVLKDKNEISLEATVPIVAGENRFTAYAFNRDNIKSADAEVVITGSQTLAHPGRTFILAIGINKYSENPIFKELNFAEKDAETFSKEIAVRQTALGRQAKVIEPLYSEKAKKNDILSALSNLRDQVQPEDTVIIYFSGHGKATKDGRFYLIPHDIGFSTQAEILDHSISDLELEEVFRAIDAARILLIIDACNAGQALGGEDERRGPMNSQGLGQLAYEKGMYVLAAAQGYQAATEARVLGYSLLADSLLREGLTVSADARRDGQITSREWFEFAARRVPQRQRELMRAAQTAGSSLVFVDQEKGDSGKKSVQTPRVFYRRETEVVPFVITAVK